MFHDLILLDLDCALRKVLSKVILSKGAKLRFFFYTNGPIFLFFVWDLLHARLNSHCKAWSYMKMKHKKIKAYRKSLQKESTAKAIQIRSKESILLGENLRVQLCEYKEAVEIHVCKIQEWFQKNRVFYQNNQQTSLKNKERELVEQVQMNIQLPN